MYLFRTNVIDLRRAGFAGIRQGMLPDETVTDLYHAHGESVQYHSEIKTDMDVEKTPIGKVWEQQTGAGADNDRI